MANAVQYKKGSAATLGLKVASGDIVVALHSLLSFVDPGDGFIDEGLPVVAGSLVGIARDDAAATSEYVPIATTGVWNLAVDADDGAPSAVAVGDLIYINTTTGVVDKNSTGATVLGIALETIASGTDTIPVLLGHRV